MKRQPEPKFRWIESGKIAGGSLTIWQDPKPEHFYSLGVDFAYGLESGDFDAAVLLRDDGEQVAEAHGHWGETFGNVLADMIDWYKPFIVGEATATGLPILRGWYDEGRWVYYQRAEDRKGRPVRDVLGHKPGPSDITIHWLRRDLRERDKPGRRRRIVVRSAACYGELCKFRFLPRAQTASIGEARDAELKWGAPLGEHDDLVRALAYANAGLEWLPQYEPPKPRLPAESVGAVLGLENFGEPEPVKSRWTR